MEVDDSIDAETLQARIDMSMSFAHDLVTSWIKPSNLAPRSTRNIEEELKEHMRRPPRLGVGAKFTEATSTAKDAAMLKQRLTSTKGGKKRAIEEVGQPTSVEDSDSDGEESRAHAIRKKVKINPQETPRRSTPQSNTKRVPPATSPPAASTSIAETAIPDSNPPPSNFETTGEACSSTSHSKKKKKKQKQSGDLDTVVLDSSSGQTSAPSSSGHRLMSPHQGSDTPLDAPLGSNNTGCKTESVAEQVTPASTTSGPSDAQPTTTPDRSSHTVNSNAPKSNPRNSTSPSKDILSLLRGPLLNLTGLSVDEPDEDAAMTSPVTSPSKKRRRRKKKKHLGAPNHGS
ncbi:hypothetical protein ONZ45_g9980 [Pleurotus djamor]|nr:hypothetical protein ONZ45_g9980 [Pleurotus djamor]